MLTQRRGEYPPFSIDKMLCWNVRGANNQQKQYLIKQFIDVQKVDFVGLLETRVKASKLGALYSNVFEGWCFSSNIVWHPWGKIVIAWNPPRFAVDIIRFTSQIMHLKVSTIDGLFSSFITVIYASNNRNERGLLWKSLEEVNTSENWCLMEDFNDISAKEERIGNKVKYYPDSAFLNCVTHCQLEDIKTSGNYFTWSNKQHGDDRIFSKIDRMLANQSWLNKYDHAEVVYMNEGLFDHSLGVLSLHPISASGRKPFKYFRIWKSHSGYDGCRKDCWKKKILGSLMFQVVTKIKHFKASLKEINKEGFNNLQHTVMMLKQEVDDWQSKVHQQPLNTEFTGKEKEAQDKLVVAQKNYSSFLQQKAKIAWLQDGDWNTAFFQSSIKQRIRANRILSIEQRDRSRTHEPNQITTAFLEYYKELLATKIDNRRKINTRVLSICPYLSAEHKEMLSKEFTKDDVKAAIFQHCWGKISLSKWILELFFPG
ncbi:uncharacterized protein LOC115695151 [Cannabis sativa]|uniref:uncharacterized protein LOC115695151 n=1 Tax=Cannabis sativa TaxID=3483 RepID=UPI0011E0595B|nr:uncharacterized protein LOC115695151 [Cannabis sativa]